MSSTPPEGPDQPGVPPPPPGYQPGDYVPFKDRSADHPGAVAGQADWSEQVRAQHEAYVAAHGPVDPYRAVYGFDAPTRVVYASWGRRVLGYLFDSLIGALASGPLIVGYVMLLSGLDTTTDAYGNETLTSDSDISAATIGLIVVGAVISLVFNIYNSIIRQGRTGYSFGKTVVGIRLVKVATGQPMGAGMCFVRQLAHYVDSLACYLGWLWPLWDKQNQTLADKIMSTVVIVQPQDAPGDPAGYVPQA